MNLSRRAFFHLTAGAGTLAALRAQVAAPSTPPLAFGPPPPRSTAAIVKGDQRRRIVGDALAAIDRQIRPLIAGKKYVVIKVNNVSTTNQLAATHADAIQGILDYLQPRFRLPVVVAESSAGDTMEGFRNFGYTKISGVQLVDLNAEARYQTIPLIDYDLHIQPVRLAARLLDPDAFVISSGILKTHNTVVATLSVKNMVLGAPLHFAPTETPRWNDKRKYHTGIRQTHYNMLLTAQKLRPNWGVAVLDGFEGMEGNGPASGTPVPSRIAIASTDYIAADRVAVECMGINPAWLGYLNYCGQLGLGNYDSARIDVIGERIAAVQQKYRMHQDIDRELEWMGEMKDLPPKIG
ncbi:MAG TPA: DUF362 domain-containing protein [Candidatus Sulfopaludibacter sp.]|nr:DUF362 domain-containing protein [Candidatus Sulfopaludibacter sp.]